MHLNSSNMNKYYFFGLWSSTTTISQKSSHCIKIGSQGCISQKWWTDISCHNKIQVKFSVSKVDETLGNFIFKKNRNKNSTKQSTLARGQYYLFSKSEKSSICKTELWKENSHDTQVIRHTEITLHSYFNVR